MCIFSKPSTNECMYGSSNRNMIRINNSLDFILQSRFSSYILFHYILDPMILINLVHTEGSDIYVWCYLYGIDDVGCMTYNIQSFSYKIRGQTSF